jgi:hypothetical protein
VVDNIDIAILTKLNDLTERHGLKPYDFVATVRQGPNGNGSVLAFETFPAGDDGTNKEFHKLINALGVNQDDGLLQGSDKDIINAIDAALRLTPKPRQRP